MKRSLILLAVLLTSGCSTHWVHTNPNYGEDVGGSSIAFLKDKAECMGIAGSATQALGGSLLGAIMYEKIKKDCLKGRGWVQD